MSVFVISHGVPLGYTTRELYLHRNNTNLCTYAVCLNCWL